MPPTVRTPALIETNTNHTITTVGCLYCFALIARDSLRPLPMKLLPGQLACIAFAVTHANHTPTAHRGVPIFLWASHKTAADRCLCREVGPDSPPRRPSPLHPLSSAPESGQCLIPDQPPRSGSSPPTGIPGRPMDGAVGPQAAEGGGEALGRQHPPARRLHRVHRRHRQAPRQRLLQVCGFAPADGGRGRRTTRGLGGNRPLPCSQDHTVRSSRPSLTPQTTP